MKAPNGETATELSVHQLEALHSLIACAPGAAMVPNIKTAIALLNRGMIERLDHGGLIDTRTLYTITAHGRKAYDITKRQSLGMEA